jgi:hypothetical protein
VRAGQTNSPTLVGVAANPGYAAEETITKPAVAANPVPAKPAPKKAVQKKG